MTIRAGPKNIQPNVFFSNTGEVVYFTSAVGIVYDAPANSQRFYLGPSTTTSTLEYLMYGGKGY